MEDEVNEQLIRYEWNPNTEVARLTYGYQVDGKDAEHDVIRHQPLAVNPLDYWDNLAVYLRLTGKVRR